MSTPLAVFGPGILIGSRTDISPQVPINVGFVNEFSIEVTGTTKQLYGQYQYPLAAARGTIKATGKFKNAVVSALAMNNLFYGMTMSTTTNLSWVIGSTYTTNSTGGTGSVQVGSSLTFDTDLGVTGSTSGLPYQRVSTGNEVAGKSYSVGSTAPGLYNFADQGVAIKVTYTQSTASIGQVLPVTNQLIGYTPTFQLDYYSNLNQPAAKPFAVRIFSCIMDKNAYAFKLEDYMMPEMDFSLFANSAGQVFNKYFPEIS